jgi:hypothetical protein
MTTKTLPSELRAIVEGLAEESLNWRPFDACFEGIIIRIYADSLAVRSELEARFSPYYSFTDASLSDKPDYVVYAVNRNLFGRFDSLVQDAGLEIQIQPHPTVERYRRYGKVVEVDEIRLVQQIPSGTYVAADSLRRQAVVSVDDELLLGKGVRQLVRDIVAGTLLVRGALELHAAGLALNGSAIAFAGESNSGKTTMLISLLRTGVPSLMCNGRLFVEDSGDTLSAIGVPEHVLVRLGTLAQFP